MTARKSLPPIPFSRRQELAGFYLLDRMEHQAETFTLPLSASSRALNGTFTWLQQKNLVDLEDRRNYITTEKGREVARDFHAKMNTLLDTYAVFSAVDLAEGVFGFDEMGSSGTPDQWSERSNDERWEDLRLAVAEYRGEDPLTVVFAGFVREERFGKDDTGAWEHDRLLGAVWDEMRDVCDSALSWRDLGWEDEQGAVSAESVIQDIIAAAIERGAPLGEVDPETPA